MTREAGHALGTGWEGWICFGTDEDESWLRRIGVKLGPMKDGGEHDCSMSDDVFNKLEPHWGRFFWGLKPMHRVGGEKP